MRFDHLMHWVPDLEAAIARCTQLGFPPQRGGRIGPQLHNSVWLGRELEYVELISVVDLEAWRRGRRGPLAASREAAMLAGGGALQFAFEVDDVEAVVADVRGRGIVMRNAAADSIRYPNGNTAQWQTAWVDEGPGWRPFFIRYPTPRGDRLASRRQQQQSDWSFQAVVLETPDPTAAATWLARLLGVGSTLVDGAPQVAAFGCAVRFEFGPTDRITRIVLDGTQGPIGDVFGVRYERADEAHRVACGAL
ncbi:MAG TPA: VOC family protein [Chloroflexota bacterium]|jgi:catechol 2,3-dioxygenase-like lactoylglutathione lyase family enzyme